jgi:hypothetical protein
MITKEDRQEALQNLVASVAVLTWSMDLEMSSAILHETAQKYGEDLVGKLMSELLPALNGEPASPDVLSTAAMLAFARPLSQKWSMTKN